VTATATFDAVTVPTLTAVSRIIHVTELGLFVAVGDSGILTSPDGTTWTSRLAGDLYTDVAWSPALGLLVAANNTSRGVQVSSDGGITWTNHPVGTYFFPAAIAWSAHQAQFVLIGAGYSSDYSLPNNSVWTSPDAVTWTGRGVPTLFDYGAGVAYSPTLDLWVIGDDCGRLWSSPDGAAWTGRTSPFDNSCAGQVNLIEWIPGDAAFYAGGTDDANPTHTPTATLAKSTNGTTWVSVPTPLLGAAGCYDVAEAGSLLYACGAVRPEAGAVYQSRDAGATWERCVTPNDATPVAMSALAYDGIATMVAGARAVTVMARANPVPPVPPAPAPRKWSNGISARIFVTTLDGEVTTWLDNIHLGATFTRPLNQPGQITVQLRPNTFMANQLYGDGDPLVAQSNRLLYILLNEGGTPPCRAAGIIMSPEDQADTDVPTTHLVAYDPWQYLNGRAFYRDTAGDLPPPIGFQFPPMPGSQIIATALKNAIFSDGVGCFIDAGPDYGGTIFWGGVLEDTPILDYIVQQGQSVADVWNGVIAAADPTGGSGGADIILTPIYDPINRPGYTHELSVYNLAGEVAPGSPIAWGQFNRSSPTADREHDGTPGAFINQAFFYAGQGGAEVGLIENRLSVAKYQPYRTTQFFPQQPRGDVVQAYARQTVILQQQGKRTFTLTPDPLRAPAPFTGYDLGDRIPVLAPNTLRVAATGYQRIQTITVQVGPDGLTRVTELQVTPDWRGETSSS
jgi:hypothetical protein